MLIKRLYINILRYFIPILFISYLAGITLFTHSHVVNGVTIVHSHPFNKDTNHSHTTTEFQLIHHLSHVITSGKFVFTLSIIFLPFLISVIAAKPETATRAIPCKGIISLRAPPVC